MNNAYQQLLQQYMNGYPQNFQQNYQPQNGLKSEIIRVNGRNGAEALNLAPNSSIFLADNTDQNRIWLCITDGAGYKTVRPIKGTFEDVEEEKNPLEDRVSKLEEIVNEINTRSDKRKQEQHDKGSDKRPDRGIQPNN